MASPKIPELNVPFDTIVKEFELEVFYAPEDASDIYVTDNDLNRPGLQLAGFYEYFSNTRIQIVGTSEMAYFNQLNTDDKHMVFDKLFAAKPPLVILARGIGANEAILESARKYKVPLLGSDENTSVLMSKIISYLNHQLAPRITRHGVLVEVYGEGLFIYGDSGVGKSETAIELVKRGHRLISDDAVEIRKVSNVTLVGHPAERIKHFMELRGVGIINVQQLFGAGGVKDAEKINMLVELEPWEPQKAYDRLGADRKYKTVMGVKVPYVLVPVRPGRNLAVILEVLAMNNRQLRTGNSAAQNLMEQLGMPPLEGEVIVEEWEHN